MDVYHKLSIVVLVDREDCYAESLVNVIHFYSCSF